MGSGAVPPIGERLRAERTRRGLSVRGLAREIGVSASLISQIETEKSQPSVSTLYAITTALGISVEDLFDSSIADKTLDAEPAAADARVVALAAAAGHLSPTESDSGGRPAAGSGFGNRPAAQRVVGPDRHRSVGPLVHPDERELLTLDSGVTWERLGQLPHSHVDFLRITYQPGGTSSSTGELMRHSGTEYGYLISGELVLTLGFDEYRLAVGDAVCFDSTTPHGYRNDGDTPAVGIWFVLERPS